ncbi:MAG: hypothetical protein HY717_06165 [Planctomycetes bacterium]|nr:hypothetical protein [Planctomycetota bacterium]
MRIKRYLLSGLVSCGLLSGRPLALAGEKPETPESGEAKEKAAPERPKAETQLLAAFKNFKNHKGYKVKMTVIGGITSDPQHVVSSPTVRDQYSGEVYQSTMYVTASETYPYKAYRTPKKGVSYIDGMWRPILAHRPGVRLDRLFAFPEDILVQAAKHSKTARWLEDAVAKEESSEASANDEEDEDDDDEEDEDDVDKDPGKDKDKAKGKEKASHKTTAVTKKSAAQLASMPRVLRVEAPPKEALNHFLQVEKSGCVSGG